MGTAKSVDPSWKAFYKISGISWLASAVLLVLCIAILLSMDNTVGRSTTELLEAAAREIVQQRIFNALALAHILFSLVGILGLFLSLKNGRKSLALLGTALCLLGLIVEIGLRITLHATNDFAISYLSTSKDDLKACYLIIANFYTGILNFGLLLSSAVSGLGILLLGIAMLSSIYQKMAAYLFIVTGILFVISSAGYSGYSALAVIGFIGNFTALVPLFMIGIRLYSLGKTIPD